MEELCNDAIQSVELLYKTAEEENKLNDQYFLNFLDKLNEISVRN